MNETSKRDEKTQAHNYNSFMITYYKTPEGHSINAK